jgi:dGTPase
MQPYGGFEHNLQSLRVVDTLEERYPEFDGLNLCFETREGILKHCSAINAQALEQLEPGGVGRRFLAHSQPSLEAQLCNLADEIAYNAHDIDDGVRSGLITLAQLQQVPLVDDVRRQILVEFPNLGERSQGRRLLYETIRRMLSAQVYDVMASSKQAIQDAAPVDVAEVRQLPALIQFSEAMASRSQVLKTFLLHELYRHPRVMDTTQLAKQVVQELFGFYQAQPAQMTEGFSARSAALVGTAEDAAARARVVADYIAGMTDRFATREHERLSGQRLLP